MNHSDAHFLPNTNRVEKGDFEDVSGIDSALDVLHVGDGKVDNHPEKRMKVSPITLSSILDTRNYSFSWCIYLFFRHYTMHTMNLCIRC